MHVLCDRKVSAKVTGVASKVQEAREVLTYI